MVRFDMPYPARPWPVRFWEKVEKTDGCWLWTAATRAFGYGMFVVRKGDAPKSAHRLSWELANGPIPAGLFVLHRCDVPACVRPDHLYLGTDRDNARDRKERDRWKRKKPINQWGEKNPNAILSDAQVASMLCELAAGGRPVSVARKYGISYKTLWAIRHRAPRD